MALVVGLGIFAWRQTQQLWLGTKTMYDHPVQVQTAVGKLEFDVLAMRLEFRNLLLTKDAQERRTAIQNSDVLEADAKRQFQLLRSIYQGPITDIEAAENAFARWVSARQSNRPLGLDGNIPEAMARVTNEGDIGIQREQLRKHIASIDAHSKNKAALLYQAATNQGSAMTRHLVISTAVVTLICLMIGGLLLHQIKKPLAELTAVTKQFRQGHLDIRSQQTSANEFGALAAAFNSMAEDIQQYTQISENAAHLAEVMLREDEIHAFCRELLKDLLTHTGSQVAAIYFQNEAQTAFVHFESIGLGTGGRAAFSATELEGELGAALATRRIQRVTDIPADCRFTFAAVSGNFTPREILTIPVLAGNSVVAVISLASVHPYSNPAIRLVNKIWSVLCARINGVLAVRKIHYFAEQLEDQNHELEAQQRELAAQTNALTTQNTELEMQKVQLNEANRLKGAFLSNMSHELRTPLNSVIALSGVLNRRLANAIPPEEYSYLEVIERNGKNLLVLINNILDLSRIEAGREDLSINTFTLRNLVCEISAMLDPIAREKNLTLSNLVDADLPRLTTDADKLQHILQNLVGNALKFTTSGGVEISACEVNDGLQVTVRDTGIGIAADQIPHIFDEFRQADDSTSRKFGGTGLGLAIAKKYAVLLGGDITVASTPGEGSTFTLQLPLRLESPEPIQPTASEPPAVARTTGPAPLGHGQRLLLVDDNQPAIIQLTDILHAQGYQVEVARDGQQALDSIAQTLPDAMILDLMMPEVDGFHVLKAIRSVERTAQIPVLILTAKHITKEELSFLTSNHIQQLIQKGDINKDGLLAAVAGMVTGTPPKPTAATPRRRPARPDPPLVLVVEDNLDNLRTACALLDQRYQIIEAMDGQTGLELARLQQPDLILTDISLPVMDGFATLAAIRQDLTLCDIPVIAVTASAMQGNREEILAHGFDGYISKPIDHDTLMLTMEKFLGHPRA